MDDVSWPPSLVLFSDGRLFLTRSEQVGKVWYPRIWQTRLARQDVCGLLNTIDQNGFFDYDPATYQGPSTDGARFTTIKVNAWKKNDGTFYDIFHVLQYFPNMYWDPINPPALINTANLLFWYTPQSELNLYTPERVAVWVYEIVEEKGVFESFANEWITATPTLLEIHSLTDSAINDFNEQYVIYQGDIAESIYQVIANDKSYSGVFMENGHLYKVFVQVLLPEQIPVKRANDLKFSDLSNSQSMKCYPSDGILPIPTPPSE